MSQTQWKQLPSHDSRVGPALSAHGDGRLYLVAVTPTGDVVCSTSAECQAGWSAWAVVNGPPGGAPLRAASDTAPVLLRHDGTLYLFCRGADNNLHKTERTGGSGWQPWRKLTTDGSVRGAISAATTRAGGACIHVAYPSTGGEVRYQRFTSTWAPAEPPSRWPGASQVVLGSDGACEVLLLVRTSQNRMAVRRRIYPWSSTWADVGERAGCLDLSNCCFFGDAFHVAYLFRTLRDDVSGSYAHFLAHARFRAGQYDDGYFRVIHAYQPHGGIHPICTLAVYRSKLVAAFADEQISVRAAYWDSADPQTPWVELGAVAGGRTKHPPALAAFDGSSGLSAAARMRANYGDDLFAAVRGGTMGGVWAINFSRAFLANRLQQVGAAADWCTNYHGSRTMGHCPAVANLPPVTELPVISEIGFGTMALPDWLMRPIFTRTMRSAGETGPYYTWVHTQQIRAYFGPHLNIDFAADYLVWHEEMGHRLASSIGIWDKGAAHVNPNLMGDLIADAVVTDANSLFGTATNAAGTCDLGSAGGGRCRGFTGIAANYDAQSVQHAWIYIIYYYMKDADFLRQLAYDDLRAGVDLLKRKYEWVRRHIFRGAEFSQDNVPLPVATIINRHSGKALDVVKWDLNDHAALQQYAAHGGDNQRWALRPDGEGCYQLMAMHSGKCLDVAASSQADGAAVQLYSGHSGGNQKWSLIPDSQGYFEIVAKHSGKCLEVAGWGTADRAPVQQYARHGGANQKWRLDFAVTC